MVPTLPPPGANRTITPSPCRCFVLHHGAPSHRKISRVGHLRLVCMYPILSESHHYLRLTVTVLDLQCCDSRLTILIRHAGDEVEPLARRPGITRLITVLQVLASDDPARGSGPRCSVLCVSLRLLSVCPSLHSSIPPRIPLLSSLSRSLPSHQGLIARRRTVSLCNLNVLRLCDVRSRASRRAFCQPSRS